MAVTPRQQWEADCADDLAQELKELIIAAAQKLKQERVVLARAKSLGWKKTPRRTLTIVSEKINGKEVSIFKDLPGNKPAGEFYTPEYS